MSRAYLLSNGTRIGYGVMSLAIIMCLVLADSAQAQNNGNRNNNNNNRRRVPEPARNREVINAKRELDQAQQQLNDARAEVTRARVNVQKAARESAPKDVGGFRSPEVTDAEMNVKNIKRELNEVGNKHLLELDNEELNMLASRLEELAFKLDQIKDKEVDPKERVTVNLAVIEARKDVEKVKRQILEKVPAYLAVLEKLKEAEKELQALRREQSELRRSELASQAAERANNPAVQQAQSSLEEVVQRSGEANGEYQKAKKAYGQALAVATAEYKNFLIQEERRRQQEAQRRANQQRNNRNRNRNRNNRNRR